MKCQTITRNNQIINHTEAGDFLQKWLLEDPQYLLLNGYGWLDGGCRILANALVCILPGANMKVVGDHRQAKPFSHVVTEIQVHGQKLYLDGDGVATEQELHDKMIVLESVKAPYIGEYDSEVLDVNGIIQNQVTSEKIASQLNSACPTFWVLLQNMKASRLDFSESNVHGPRFC